MAAGLQIPISREQPRSTHAVLRQDGGAVYSATHYETELRSHSFRSKSTYMRSFGDDQLQMFDLGVAALDFSCAKCISRNWHNGKAVRGPGRMSSTPHSSASHQSSAVLEEVTSTIGITTPLHLIRSTRSLQLPSGIASSVTTTVFSSRALSK